MQATNPAHLAATGYGATRPVTAPGAVTGEARRWLRIEGLAALAAGAAVFLAQGGQLIWLVPLVLAVDLSMVGYLRGPRPGAFQYNIAHNQALGIL
ncbi:MAG: DUF4260 family protein, partial [Chloroflexi bacterium]|nr:DUF4260 family protein [Chloroflexota bacterium]